MSKKTLHKPVLSAIAIIIAVSSSLNSCSFTDGELNDLTRKPMCWKLISENSSPDTPISARRGFAIAGTGNGSIYIFGGYNGSYLADLWKYNFSRNIWTAPGPPSSPAARERGVMVYTEDNCIILYGGNNGSDLNDTWRYDIQSNTWTNLAPSSSPTAGRSSHGMCYTHNGRVLMAGGTPGSGELWEYDISLNTWTLIVPPADDASGGRPFVNRYGHWMEYMGNGLVYLFGGYDTETAITSATGYVNDLWITNINNSYIWSKNIKSGVPGLPPERQDTRILNTYNGKITLFGGYNGTYFDDTWLFDLHDNRWSQIINDLRPEARSLHGMVYTEKNELILFGGYYNDGTDHYLNDVWKFYAGP